MFDYYMSTQRGVHTLVAPCLIIGGRAMFRRPYFHRPLARGQVSTICVVTADNLKHHSTQKWQERKDYDTGVKKLGVEQTTPVHVCSGNDILVHANLNRPVMGEPQAIKM